MFFDFHHHSLEKKGIYNLNFLETPIPNRVFSVGFHPKHSYDITQKEWDWLYSHSQSPFCWAIGECGLDALIGVEERQQERILEQQIDWANQIQKAMIIHCVRRFSSLLKFKKKAQIPMIIHGFNKKESIAQELLAYGFYLSFGKSVLYNEALQKLVTSIPLEKFFLETDADDISIEIIYQKVASLKQISIQELQKNIQKNIENII